MWLFNAVPEVIKQIEEVWKESGTREEVEKATFTAINQMLNDESIPDVRAIFQPMGNRTSSKDED